MSNRIVTINLSTFTFEQLEEAFSQLAVIPRSSALFDELCRELYQELEARNAVA